MKTEFELAILRAFGSNKECAKYMGWTPSAVTKIVTGKRKLKADEIEKLEKKFDVRSYDQFKAIFFDIKLPNGN